MKKRISFFGLLTVVMLAALSMVFVSCGDDDDADVPSWVVGSWQECNSYGKVYDDATNYEVHHMTVYSNGTGRMWFVTKGSEDDAFTFRFSIASEGTTGTITMTVTSGKYAGETETVSYTYENGILSTSGGEILYKKVEETSSTKEDLVAQSFVGKWTGYGTWEFKADGTCSYSKNSSYTGTWTYIPESQTLVTNVLNWSWKVVSIAENQWVGTHLAGKGTTTTYSRIQ